MRAPLPLPQTLGEQFSVRQAAEAGVTPARLRARDLDTPFHGVRTRGTAEHAVLGARIAELALAFACKMTTHEFFSHVTAAALWGIPLPPHLARQASIDVALREALPRVRVARRRRRRPGRD